MPDAWVVIVRSVVTPKETRAGTASSTVKWVLRYIRNYCISEANNKPCGVIFSYTDEAAGRTNLQKPHSSERSSCGMRSNWSQPICKFSSAPTASSEIDGLTRICLYTVLCLIEITETQICLLWAILEAKQLGKWIHPHLHQFAILLLHLFCKRKYTKTAWKQGERLNR